jgi:hypothetical protein
MMQSGLLYGWSLQFSAILPNSTSELAFILCITHMGWTYISNIRRIPDLRVSV